ncbi:MAG: addiction module protein [Deltaproteobacteria bacterium]|nr:addiction module protein [Deltaproteobacteria bacterium]
MDKEVTTLLEKALNMPQHQRAFIAEQLIESLDARFDPDVETAWQQEIQARMAEAERGEADFLSWEDAKKRLRGE